MEQRDNMHNGKLYDPNDDSVMEEQMVCLDRLYDFNQTRPSEMDKRNAIMKEMMGDVGKDCYIEPPFHANWGGKHVHFGDGVYANFGLTCVDDTHIYVGSHTFGPNVVLATAGHPMLPELRKHGIQYNMPIHIGENCWLGAGVIVVPGVTIGDNVVIGASSVVNPRIFRPIGSNGYAMPCRSTINDHDKEYYFKNKKIDWSEMQQFLD